MTGVPGRRVGLPVHLRLSQYFGKLLTPLVLHIQGQGVGKILFKKFRRLFRRIEDIEAVLFCHREVHLEPLDLVHDLATH